MSLEKTIDGLPTRRATSSRAVPMKTAKRHSLEQPVFGHHHKSTQAQTNSTKAPIQTPARSSTKRSTQSPRQSAKQASAARADFLKPVNSFDFDLNERDLKKQAKNMKDKKTKKKPSRKRKVITTIALIIVLALIGGVIWLMVWGNDLIAKFTGGNSSIWDAIGALTSETYVDLKTDAQGRTNILIFGTSGYDMEGNAWGHKHDGSQLTDSIMVVSIDQKTGDTAMTSIPRDLKVPKACYAGKINEVYLCNNNDGDAAGAAALEQVVSEVLGIDFQYYVHINWGSLVQVVDTLGGITVTLDEDVKDNYTGTYINAGVPTTLDGEKALGLARARHGTAGGDFSRGTSQQKIIIALKDRITEKMNEGSFGISEALGLVSALNDNLRSDISIDEIKTAIHLLSELDLSQMRQIMLYNYNDYANSYMKTATINNLSYVIPVAGAGNYTKIHEFIAKEFNSDVVVREAAPILVLNGSSVSGLAASTAKELGDDNYVIENYANAPAGEYTEQYYLYLLDDTAAGTAEKLSDRYGVVISSADQLPAGIATGKAKIVLICGEQDTKN